MFTIKNLCAIRCSLKLYVFFIEYKKYTIRPLRIEKICTEGKMHLPHHLSSQRNAWGI